MSLTIEQLVELCGSRAYAAGWYDNFNRVRDTLKTYTPEDERFFVTTFNASRMALIHSEVSEAMEGVRKDKMDDHLPHMKSDAVELADAVIRIADYCYANNIDLEAAITQKLEYNAVRKDHKKEHRESEGGKQI